MKIRVRVHPGARVAKTEQRGGELHVWVNAPPADGKANASVIEVLAELHHVPKSAVRIASGHTSRTKVFELDGI
ncbi:MAG: DUF167 domain-containing protein [Vicinamibacteria bacterium]|nr:DUF167 domain-containing protein [Vicinamibacteria bacterium]